MAGGKAKELIFRLALSEVIHYTRWGLYSQATTLVVVYAVWKCIPLAPGEAIAGLAVAAVIMTVRAQYFTKIEQVLWVVIAFLYLSLEIHAIHDDRSLHETQERQDAKSRQDEFEQTLKGFENLSVQNQINLGKTVGRINNVLGVAEATELASRQNLDAVSGADSIPCIVPELAGVVNDKVPFALWNRGKNNLTGVEVRILSHREFMSSEAEMNKSPISIGTLHPTWPRTLPGIEPELDTVEDLPIAHYSAEIWTQNGYYTEEINFRRSKYLLPWAYQYWLQKILVQDKPSKLMPKGAVYNKLFPECSQVQWSDDLGEGKSNSEAMQ